MEITIYHNPKCSKSRQTKDLLEQKGVNPKVVAYLEQTPSAQEILALIQKLGIAPSSLVRFKEERAKELGLSAKDTRTGEEWAKLLSENPKLIERPIVVKGDRAVLGRPPENVLTLLEDA